MYDEGEPEARLTIGQFAEIALLSAKALRIYDERGLLKPDRVDPDSGYRYYAAGQAATGRVISLLRAADVSLDEITRIVRTGDASHAAVQLDALIRSRRRESDIAEALLRQVREHFVNVLPEESAGRGDATEVVMPGEYVFSHIARVKVAELDDHIRRTIGQLEAVADQQGLRGGGRPFGIFHGPVTGDVSGPLEVALPVQGLGESAGDVRSYRLPGGHMACVTTVGPDTDYPLILTAYDRACQWIEQRGFHQTGPPRELWRTLPWEGTAHMVVAWPFARPLATRPETS